MRTYLLRTFGTAGVALACGLIATVLVAQTPAPRPQTPRGQAVPSQPQGSQPPGQGRPQSSTPAQREIVARLGDVEISADELRADIAALNPREQAAVARDPAALSRVVRLLLVNRLVLKEARDKDWERQPGVAVRLERAKEAAIIETFLQAMSAVPDGFPNDAQIQAVYESNMSAMLVPRQFHIAQIFIAVSPSGDKDAEDKARRKLTMVQNKLKQAGADFSAIAAAESDDRASAQKGGELGWLSDTQLRPEIRAQVAGAEKGATGDPIRLEDGWHIIRLLDTKAAYTRPLSEVREQLVEQIREERVAANRRAVVARLSERSPAAINELALSRLLEKPVR